MKQIQEAVTAYLELASGVRTVCDRSLVTEYPMLAVALQEQGTVLIDGGRQAEHRYLVTVTAVSDRRRDGNTTMLSELSGLLLRGVPALLDGQARTLHPLDIHTEGEELTFSLAICMPVPPVSYAGQEATETMQALHLGL